MSIYRKLLFALNLVRLWNCLLSSLLGSPADLVLIERIKKAGQALAARSTFRQTNDGGPAQLRNIIRLFSTGQNIYCWIPQKSGLQFLSQGKNYFVWVSAGRQPSGGVAKVWPTISCATDVKHGLHIWTFVRSVRTLPQFRTSYCNLHDIS